MCVCFLVLGARGRKPEPGAELRTWVFVEWSREVKESERRVVGRKKTLMGEGKYGLGDRACPQIVSDRACPQIVSQREFPPPALPQATLAGCNPHIAG